MYEINYYNITYLCYALTITTTPLQFFKQGKIIVTGEQLGIKYNWELRTCK